MSSASGEERSGRGSLYLWHGRIRSKRLIKLSSETWWTPSKRYLQGTASCAVFFFSYGITCSAFQGEMPSGKDEVQIILLCMASIYILPSIQVRIVRTLIQTVEQLSQMVGPGSTGHLGTVRSVHSELVEVSDQ